MEEPKSIGNIYDKEKVAQYYETVGDDIENKTQEGQYMLNILPENLEGKTVLDLGCGNGRYCELFCKLGAKKVIGLDFSGEMLNKAQKRKRTNDLEQTEFIKADMAQLPLSPETLDLVFSRFSLMHVKDLRPVIKRISSALKKHGEFYILCSIAQIKNPDFIDRIKEEPVLIEVNVGDKNVPLLNYAQTLDDYKNAFAAAGLDLDDEKYFTANEIAVPNYKYKDEISYKLGVFKLSKNN